MNITHIWGSFYNILIAVLYSSGVFYVRRDLANFTKHRVLDLGVGTDVVCLGPKPLHATPLFVYNRIKVQDKFFDKYQACLDSDFIQVIVNLTIGVVDIISDQKMVRLWKL